MTKQESLSDELNRHLMADHEFLHGNLGFLERIAVEKMSNSTEWTRCKGILREKSMFTDFNRQITEIMRGLQRVASIGPPSDAHALVMKKWPEAAVHSEASAPPGFDFEHPEAGAVYKRIIKEKADGSASAKFITVSRNPIVIRRRIMHDDGSISLELAWRVGPKNWHTGIYNREYILDASKIVARTAGDGVPVSSNNKDLLVEYLHAYEDHNLPVIPRGWSSSAMGWQGERGNTTQHGFLFGRRQIGGNGKEIAFRGAGPGDDEDADLYTQGGTFEAWKAAWKKLEDYPAFKIMLYAALAAPLLTIVGAPNMIIEVVGDTSRGKTTAMQAAQACWRPATTTFDNWYNTANGFEAKAHLHTDMPLLIDDTKTAIEQGRGGQLAKIIYQFVSGRGRGRGARDGGQRATHSWRSIMISSGEVPSSDLAKSEGAAARVLSLWGTPLGDNVDVKTATLAIEVVEGQLGENYGHAGPRVVQWLCKNRDVWANLKRSYLATATKVREKFAGAAASRLAKVIALLDIASYVASEAGCLPWAWKSILDDEAIVKLLQTALEHANKAADHAGDAWRQILSYAEARASQWTEFGSIQDRDREPSMGWLGWRNDEHYYWYPSQLKRALKESPFADEADVILRKWKDRKIMETASSRLGTSVRCLPDKAKAMWLVPITRKDEDQPKPPQQELDIDDFPNDDIPF